MHNYQRSLKEATAAAARHRDKANHVTTNIGRWTLLEGSTLFPQTPRFLRQFYFCLITLYWKSFSYTKEEDMTDSVRLFKWVILTSRRVQILS